MNLKKDDVPYIKAFNKEYPFNMDILVGLFNALDVNFYFMDDQARYQLISQSPAKVLRIFGNDLIGKTNEDVQLNKENGEKLYKEDLDIIKTGKSYKEEIKVDSEGRITAFEMIRNPVFDNNGKIIGICGLVKLAHKEDKKSKRLQMLSFTDLLTQTKNRNFLDVWLRKEAKHGASSKTLPLTVIMCDVNNLKKTNDLRGHYYGDVLLKEVAKVIKKQVAGVGNVIRYGGDEFVALCPRTDEEKAQVIKMKIQKAVSEVETDGLRFSVAVGSKTITDPDYSISQAIDEADKAMYEDKEISKTQGFNCR